MINTLKKYFYFLTALVFLGLCVYMFITYYSFIFSKRIEGQVFDIKRVNQPSMILGSTNNMVNPSLMHSYAVAIRTIKGEIITASGDDSQWEVVQKGLCVVATFYPYPPWNLQKSGTYTNARLNELKDCTDEYSKLTPIHDVQKAPAEQPKSLEDAAPSDAE